MHSWALSGKTSPLIRRILAANSFNITHRAYATLSGSSNPVSSSSSLRLLAGSSHGQSDDSSTSGRSLSSAVFAVGWSTGLYYWYLDSFYCSADSAGQTDELIKKPKFLFGDAYRKKVFFKYEKRIRTQSTPEKVFEYFASFQTSSGQKFMTPTDLMRAVVPVFPPSEATQIRGGYLPGEKAPGELHCPPSEFFMLFDTNNDGLISFAEYIFFITLLSIPESSFSVAFKMFDLDNNGVIDKEEFRKVMALMRTHNRQGARQKGGLRLGLKVSESVENGGLLEYFFGKDGKEFLEHKKFIKFLDDLHREILRLEFAHYDHKSRGTISATDFALSVVASADMKNINKFLDRVDEQKNEPNLRDMRITFEEFENFALLRKKVRPLSVAIFCYGQVNGLLTKQDFRRAAHQVCGIDLTEKVVDLIFYIFDTNGDGRLSSDEFLRVCQRRETDISKPRESGFMELVLCWLDCTQNCSLPRNLL